MNLLVLSNASYWRMIFPFIILLSIAVVIPIFITVLKLKFIPVLVVEILVGMIISNIPILQQFFVNEEKNLNLLSQGLYILGLSMLLFLSGLDTDYSILKRGKNNKNKGISIFGISWLLVVLVIGLSLASSFLFTSYFNDQSEKKVILGIVLLTIFFSSTFASLVIPVVHDKKKEHTIIGKIICTYATLMEFISLLSISILMIILKITDNTNPWMVIFIILFLIIVYLITHFVKREKFERVMNGIVHLDIRIILLSLIIVCILSQISGVEFILGAFLLGAVISSAGLKSTTKEKIESIGYGILVPMFYILVGFNVGLITPFKSFFTSTNLLLTLEVFGILVLVKIPFLILSKWYKLLTVIPTMFLATSTIIVGIACEHFGIIKGELYTSIIIASVLSCLIPPVFFANNKTYGIMRPKYSSIDTNQQDIMNNE